MTWAGIRRRLVAAAAILVFFLLAGATYQGVATSLERREFPRRGGLVDVGGHQLHITCTGEGAPVVVLEAPALSMSAAWGWVEPQVAEATRVCVYDRAGLGWSEAGERRYEPAIVVEQLHALLEGAGEPPPYVLAGQGLGAAFATLYASQFPGEIGALVLIDPPQGDVPELDRLVRLARWSPWLARTGLLRARPGTLASVEGLPAADAGALTAFLYRPDHLTHAGRELARWNDAVRQAADAPLPPELPVRRVEAAGSHPAALLSNRAAADVAARVVLDAVATLRERGPSAAPPAAP